MYIPRFTFFGHGQWVHYTVVMGWEWGRDKSVNEVGPVSFSTFPFSLHLSLSLYKLIIICFFFSFFWALFKYSGHNLVRSGGPTSLLYKKFSYTHSLSKNKKKSGDRVITRKLLGYSTTKFPCITQKYFPDNTQYSVFPCLHRLVMDLSLSSGGYFGSGHDFFRMC